MNRPSDYGVPHPKWRPHQLESVEWALGVGDVGILEAAVGSGKTAICAATASRKTVVSLVRTKFLQEQYGALYSFDLLKGRSNYRCTHPNSALGAMADSCLYSGKSMYLCEVSKDCPYLVAKNIARSSRKLCTNYSYWLSAAWIRKDLPQALFLDEAHNVDSLTLDHVGLKVSERRRRDWSLPAFPTITGMASGSLDAVSTPTGDALGWLVGARNVLALQYRRLQASADDEKTRKRARRCERFGSSVRATIDALNHCSDDWFVRSGDDVLYFNGESVPGFIARPLTAKYHFPRYFRNGVTVAMSATIGDLGTFAKELGIQSYVDRSVPSRWPPEARRVYLLDAPKMRHGSTYLDYEHQADVVADAIKTCPDDWSGILHVTRKAEAPLVANRLARRGLQDRVWVSPQGPTEGQIAAWERRKARHPGSLMVAWAFQEGMDAREEKICIVVKCFTPDVKLFGPQGEVNCDQVKVGDEVFALDSEGTFILDHVQAVIIKDWDGSILNFVSKKYDVSVTPDHMMLARKFEKGQKIREIEASKLAGTYGFLPVTSTNWDGNPLGEFVEFTKFFRASTLIWYRPLALPNRHHRYSLPDCFREARGNKRKGGKRDRRRFYVAHWYELQRINWCPQPGFRELYFSDRPHGRRFPFFWESSLFLELLAWYVTEGHVNYYKHAGGTENWSFGISQNPGPNLDRILEIVDALCLTYHVCQKKKKVNRDIVINSRVLFDAFSEMGGSKSREKKLPRFALNTDTTTLRRLFDTLMAGDGYTKRGYCYSTSSLQLKNQFVELCLKLGFAVSTRKPRPGAWHIEVGIKRNKGTLAPSHASIQHYQGKVWCVTTKTGTLLVTRNGKFVFTGNCPFGNLGDPYEKARFDYSHGGYSLRAAQKLMQACGRTRRGREQDYDIGERRGLVCIADANWYRTRHYLSESFKEGLAEWE